jgi:YVTN family beta-propeller protein
MKKSIFLSLTIAISILLATQTYSQANQYKLKNTFHIASAGGWDYIAINPLNNKLYVSHGTQVNILDKTTGDSLGIIANTIGVHGIAFINQLKKGYTSNGKTNDITVFNLDNNEVITKIATGENPDAIFFEEFSKRIITCNGKSKDLSIIDPATNMVIATIPVGGKPETAVSDNAGNIFVNVEDKSEIVKIDMGTNKVVEHWSVAPGEEPTGLAIDLKTKRLFVGTDKKLIVIDASNGKLVANLPIGEGCDGVAFDNILKYICTSNGEGTMTIVKENSANNFKVIETVQTKKGARTIVNDETTHLVYLPTADFEEQQPGDKSRPKMIPGSFQIIVFGNN